MRAQIWTSRSKRESMLMASGRRRLQPSAGSAEHARRRAHEEAKKHVKARTAYKIVEGQTRNNNRSKNTQSLWCVTCFFLQLLQSKKKKGNDPIDTRLSLSLPRPTHLTPHPPSTHPAATRCFAVGCFERSNGISLGSSRRDVTTRGDPHHHGQLRSERTMTV